MAGTTQGDFRGLALIGTAVAEIVVPVVIGVWVDERYSCQPWGVTIGAVVGIVGSIVHLLLMNRTSGGNG